MALLCLFFAQAAQGEVDLLAQAGCVPGKISQHGGQFKSFKTGYFPDSSEMQGGYVDRKGKPLQTLQNYLRGRAPYVSVAMDHTDRRFPYGTMLRIPDLEKRYGRCILFRVVDTGGAFVGRGHSKIDVCNDSYNSAVSMNGWSQVYVVPQGLTH
jgi:3D (Asp-Asp-Asp) domain-containing protein